MGHSLNNSKLGEKTILRVCKMHAEGWKNIHISETTELAPSTIRGIVTEADNKQFIDEYRKQYMGAVYDVPVANKRIRLDDIEKLRVRLLGELLLAESGDVQTVCKLARELIGALERAQNEMEQKPFVIQQIIAGYNAFGRLSDEQLYEEREKLIEVARRSLAPPPIDAEATDVGGG